MVVSHKRRGDFNYEKPKSSMGGDFYSSYGEYHVHMMIGGSNKGN